MQKKVSITECSSIWDNQYFDIVTELPEKTTADFRPDFVYWYIQSGTVISSCNELNANTSGIFGSTFCDENFFDNSDPKFIIL